MFSVDKDILQFLCGYLGKSDDQAFKCCSDFAYRDMCRTITFAASFKEKEPGKNESAQAKSIRLAQNKMIRNEKQKRRKSVTALIQMRVEYLLKNPPKSHDEFNRVHESICKAITNEYKGTTDQGEKDGSLFYGQAQKWLNMTLKNLYVYSKCNDTKLDMNKLVPYMHVPIDSIIINEAKKIGVEAPSASWSIMDKDEYISYQEELRKMIKKKSPHEDPILWEIKKWNQIARNGN